MEVIENKEWLSGEGLFQEQVDTHLSQQQKFVRVSQARKKREEEKGFCKGPEETYCGWNEVRAGGRPGREEHQWRGQAGGPHPALGRSSRFILSEMESTWKPSSRAVLPVHSITRSGCGVRVDQNAGRVKAGQSVGTKAVVPGEEWRQGELF